MAVDAGSQQQVNALLNAEIDYVQMPLIDLFPPLKQDANVALIEASRPGRQLVFRFNWLTKPFDHAKNRQAAWYALNQEDFLKGFIGNADYYETCHSIFACNTRWQTEIGMDSLVRSDVARAKALLQEAGYDSTPVDRSPRSCWSRAASRLICNIWKVRPGMRGSRRRGAQRRLLPSLAIARSSWL